jgi:long-chain acyl-CoA synthetase
MDDKPWFKFYEPGMPRSLQPYPQRTLLDVVANTACQRPEHPALIFKDNWLTYAQLDRLSDSFGFALVELGVRKGDRVAFLLPNSPQAVIAQLGAWKAGAIVCPLNALYAERELEQMLNEIGAETIVVLTPFYFKAKSLQARTQVRRVIVTNIKEYLPRMLRILFTLAKERQDGHHISLRPGDLWMRDLIRQHSQPGLSTVQINPKDPAILLFSGGTTGAPKAALGTHHALLISAMQLHEYAKTVLSDWSDILTWVMPIFHIYGNMAMNTSFVARWPMAVVPNPRDLDDLIETIAKTRPAVLHGVPALFNALLEHPKVQAGEADFRSIKVCYSAAAPLHAETKRRFEELTGGCLLEGYAMTETMLSAVVCPVRGPYKEGSVGIPLPDVDVRIADLKTGEGNLPPGQVGEIVIRAPQLMLGYWNRPAETAEMLRDGWLYTGDIGYMDEDGFLFIVDRKKDLIKPAGGFQVWPREVEEVIATHPAVVDVSVAGVKDEIQGEAVTAWVVLRGGESVTADDLRIYCRKKLANYKVPKQIHFRESLPKTMVGKVLRRELVKEARPQTTG